MLKANIGGAEDHLNTDSLEEDFLLFLAEVTVSEGENIDPLSMLDIDHDALNQGEAIQVSTSQQTSNKKDINVMKQKIPAIMPIKEEQ